MKNSIEVCCLKMATELGLLQQGRLFHSSAWASTLLVG